MAMAVDAVCVNLSRGRRAAPGARRRLRHGTSAVVLSLAAVSPAGADARISLELSGENRIPVEDYREPASTCMTSACIATSPRSIDAWRASEHAPRLSIRSHIFSGDRGAGDRRLQTFEPRFPNTTLFTQSGLFSPANSTDVQPRVSLSPAHRVRVSASVDVFWRFSTGNALYRPPLAPPISGRANDRRFLGCIGEIVVRWCACEQVEVVAAYDIGDAAGFITVAGELAPLARGAPGRARAVA